MFNPTFSNTSPSFTGEGQPVQSAPPVRSKSGPRRRWITLGVLGALLLALVAGALIFVAAQLGAPGTAATRLCGDLKAQDYRAAYGLLSARLRAQLREDSFVQDARALDTAEGKVWACGQASGSGAYQYQLFASTASIRLAIGRSAVRQGPIGLKSERGAWKIDSLATSLLGAPLGALETLRAYCAALQRQDYPAAYALLDSQLQAASTQDNFSQLATDHDGIDGTVSACGLAGVAPGNTDATAQLTASITRSKLGRRLGTLTLQTAGGAWTITDISAALQGTDLGSVQVATQLCVDLAIGDFADAYTGLTSSAFQAAVTQDQFNAFFRLPPGESYTGCNLDLTTFTLSSATSSFAVKFQIQVDATGQTGSVLATLTFVQENGAWKILRVETHS